MTGKTILYIGAGLAGAFVLYKVLSPSSSAKPATSGSATFNANQSSFVTAGASIGALFAGLFASKAAPSTAVSGGSYTASSFTAQPGYVYSGPTVPAGFDTSNYTVSDGFMFTDANGNFVAG